MCKQMEQVKAEGRAEGVSIGEYNKAKEMAISLNKAGVDISIIAQSAKASIEQVKSWLAEKN